jgi:hypothetical protein
MEPAATVISTLVNQPSLALLDIYRHDVLYLTTIRTGGPVLLYSSFSGSSFLLLLTH